LVNHGLVLARDGGRVRVLASATNAASGTLHAAPGGTLALADGAPVPRSPIVNNGTLRVDPGATLELFAPLTNNGRLELNGAIAPAGDQVGQVSLQGDLHLATTSALLTQIGNTTADRLIVTGHVDLAGELRLSVNPAFPPVPGSTFPVLQFASASGAFDRLTLTSNAAGLAWETLYTADAVAVACAALFPGDANLDALVNTSDVYAIYANWHRTGDWLDGDFNADNFVDIADLQILGLNWQGTRASLDRDLALYRLPSVVPEPATPALLTCAALSLSRRRRRRPLRA
jgi:hypothetical protein